jgi:membrane protease YdiL (CAAX protease family)
VTGAVASRTHLLVVLAIAGVVTLIGIVEAPAGAASVSRSSRIGGYTALVALQWLWVRYVRAGMHRRGRALTELTGARWGTGRVVADLGVGLLAYAAAVALTSVAKSFVGGHANTAFLQPQGWLETAVWIAVSCTAGICEEIVYRGYLQRQFAAISRSLPIAVLLQAIVFGLSHAYQGAASVVVSAVFGLTPGIVVAIRGNVRAAALAHALTDIIGGLASFS